MPSIPNFFLVRPVDWTFVILDRFNAPRNYTFAPNKKQLHEGIDLGIVKADGRLSAILAAQRGIVKEVGWAPEGYGKYVRIYHSWPDGSEWVTWYGHLSEIAVGVNQFVLAGQKIGVGGSTGFSTGPHLHLTLQHIGHGLSGYTVDDVVDPEGFFNLGRPPKIYEASYLGDVTIPDGTEVLPGESFRKVWRIRNTGNTAWDADYKLAFSGIDERMEGPEAVDLPRVPVEPGGSIEIAVRLTAPDAPGRHRSSWQIRHPDGELFLQRFYAEVRVKEVEEFDRAAFVADVTVEDGTIIQPGQQFVKTWRIRNTGTTTWDQNYTLRFSADERMGGPDRLPLPKQVAPGGTVDLSLTLTAPTQSGSYRSTWRLFNGQGQPFDFTLYADIRVPQQTVPAEGLNEMRYVADVTIPDETQVQPGQPFVKTWRIRNSGTTIWGAGYTLAFFGDDRMGGPESVPLPAARPGDEVEVSVSLTAPNQPGLRRSTWKPRDPQGEFFEFEMFALVDVAAVAPFNELSWRADVTVEDGTIMRPGQSFDKTWRIRNSGTTTWGAGYRLAFFGDKRMGGLESVPLPVARPGDEVEVSVSLTVPAGFGLHKSTWKGRDPQGRFFEYDIFALIEVVDPDQKVDLLPYMRGDGHLYELACSWIGGARQRVQTQFEGNRFYHVKNTQWEEMWVDDDFIYRGTDTSPGGGEVYTLFEGDRYGSPWIPRHIQVGIPFRRAPQVVFRRKSDGVETRRFEQVSWIQLEAVYQNHKVPGGFDLADVAVLTAHSDANGQPAREPFERYYYAQKYGLVAWENAEGWQSTLAAKFIPGSPPDNEREVLPWL
jgi:hypothetical protein